MEDKKRTTMRKKHYCPKCGAFKKPDGKASCMKCGFQGKPRDFVHRMR